jgi:DUF917 family protein
MNSDLDGVNKFRNNYLNHMFMDKYLLEYLLQGAALLGSGGGGSKAAGTVFKDSILSRTRGIELLTHPLSQSDQSRTACIVCDIGAVSAFDEHQVSALQHAFEGLTEAFLNKMGPITALFPIEIGPENVLAPFVLASIYPGVAVIDGDGAGRAVPTIPLSTFSIQPPRNWQPVALASGKGDLMMVTSDRVENFDTLLRKVAHLPDFSDSASLALWPDIVGTLWEKSVQGSVSRGVYCGMLLEGITSGSQILIDAALPAVNALQGWLIGQGKLLYKQTSKSRGFDFTTTKFQSGSEILTVISQNENLMVFSDQADGPIALAPDSICYLKADMTPLTNAEIALTNNLTEEHFFIIGVQASEKLGHPIIREGFDAIVQDLRYNTCKSIITQQAIPLGELLLHLAPPPAQNPRGAIPMR